MFYQGRECIFGITNVADGAGLKAVYLRHCLIPKLLLSAYRNNFPGRIYKKPQDFPVCFPIV